TPSDVTRDATSSAVRRISPAVWTPTRSADESLLKPSVDAGSADKRVPRQSAAISGKTSWIVAWSSVRVSRRSSPGPTREDSQRHRTAAGLNCAYEVSLEPWTVAWFPFPGAVGLLRPPGSSEEHPRSATLRQAATADRPQRARRAPSVPD